jgi:hypothetical protein
MEKIILYKQLKEQSNTKIQEFLSCLLLPSKPNKEPKQLLINYLKIVAFGKGKSVGFLL